MTRLIWVWSVVDGRLYKRVPFINKKSANNYQHNHLRQRLGLPLKRKHMTWGL